MHLLMASSPCSLHRCGPAPPRTQLVHGPSVGPVDTAHNLNAECGAHELVLRVGRLKRFDAAVVVPSLDCGNLTVRHALAGVYDLRARRPP